MSASNVIWTPVPASYRWVGEALANAIQNYFAGFVREHGWVEFVWLDESFAVAPSDLNVYPDRELQRAGTPIVNVEAVRAADRRRFEVSVPFPNGNDTDVSTRDSLLRAVRESLRELEKAAR